MRTTANRPKYKRDKLRYPSDVTGGMGAYRTADSLSQTWWPQAQGRCARSCEWDNVRAEQGLPMALCSQGPSTQKHARRLFRSLDLRRHVGDYPSHALCAVPPANRARGQPRRLRHRLSEREKRRKEGPRSKRASPITSVQATGSGATGALGALIWKAEEGKKDPSQ
jgi:hypothetical protein